MKRGCHGNYIVVVLIGPETLVSVKFVFPLCYLSQLYFSLTPFLYFSTCLSHIVCTFHCICSLCLVIIILVYHLISSSSHVSDIHKHSKNIFSTREYTTLTKRWWCNSYTIVLWIYTMVWMISIFMYSTLELSTSHEYKIGPETLNSPSLPQQMVGQMLILLENVDQFQKVWFSIHFCSCFNVTWMGEMLIEH